MSTANRKHGRVGASRLAIPLALVCAVGTGGCGGGPGAGDGNGPLDGAAGENGNADASVASDAASAKDAGARVDAMAPNGSDGGGVSEAAPAAEAASPAPVVKQALVWLWQGYASMLSELGKNPTSFTHVSPTFYTVDYAYASGVAQFQGGDNFEGMTSLQITQQVHAIGMKVVPAVQAGAGNNGTDQGIENILNDSPAGAQQSFITSMLGEAMTKGYDGYNLDWEPNTTTYAAYGAKYLSFLAAFKSALNAQHMALSIDVGTWYTLQCADSCGTGMIDLTQLGASVDTAIIMDYTGTFGGPPTSCPAQNPKQQDCASNFVDGVSVMCNMPPANVSIGMISGQTNAYLPQGLQTVAMYGFGGVAVWPSGGGLDSSGIPQGATWYSSYAHFLGH